MSKSYFKVVLSEKSEGRKAEDKEQETGTDEDKETNTGGNPGENTDEKSSGRESSALVPDTGGGYNRYDFLTPEVSFFGFGCLALIIIFIVLRLIKKNKKSHISHKKAHFRALKTLILVFFLSTLGFLGFSVKETSKAATTTIEHSINTPSEIFLNANILGSSDIAYTKVSIMAMENYNSGYKIYMSASDTKLRSTDGSAIINSLSKSGTLENNTFGYSLEKPTGDLKNFIFSPIHLEKDRDLLFDLNRPIKAGETFDLYFAVRSSDLKAGTYELDLDFKAISGMPTVMQDMNPAACDAMQVGEEYRLKDLRDNKIYTATKLNDGNCWMTSDLALELNTSKKLTSETTDLNSKTEFTPNRNTFKTNELSAWTECESAEECAENRSYHYQDGEAEAYYYSYYTAVLNSTSFESGMNYGAEDSICPRGWHLPDYLTSNNLIERYFNNVVFLNAHAKMALNGRIDVYDLKDGKSFITELKHYGERAGYLTSSSEGDSAVFIQIKYYDDESYIEIESKDAYDGYAVRCVADRTSPATIIFSTEDPEHVSNIPNPIYTTSRFGIINFTIPDVVPAREGYDFLGWNILNLIDDENELLPPGAKLSLPAYGLVFDAVWRPKNAVEIRFKGNSEVDHFPDSFYVTKYNCGNETCLIDLKIPSKTPTHEDNKEFLGWENEEYGAGEIFEADHSYTLTIEKDIDHLYLEAVFEESQSYEPVNVMFFDGVKEEEIDMPDNIQQVEKEDCSEDTHNCRIRFYIPSFKPVRKGYNFLGWSRYEFDNTPEIQPGKYADFEVHRYQVEFNLYAVWGQDVVEYNVTVYFEDNGDNVKNMPDPKYRTVAKEYDRQKDYYSINFALDTLPTPTRDGYSFKGWSENPSAWSGSFTEYHATVGAQTAEFHIYAIWKPTNVITIYFDANADKDYVAYMPATITSETIESCYKDGYYCNSPSFIPIDESSWSEPQREGYTFQYWTSSDIILYEKTYEPVSPEISAHGFYHCATVANGSCTLRAVWQYNGSTPDPASNPNPDPDPDPDPMSSILVYYLSGVENDEGVSDMPSSPVPVDIYYQDGDKDYYRRATISITNTEPKREGYRFIGWRRDDSSSNGHEIGEYGINHSAGASVDITEIDIERDPHSITYVAQWEEDGKSDPLGVVKASEPQSQPDNSLIYALLGFSSGLAIAFATAFIVTKRSQNRRED